MRTVSLEGGKYEIIDHEDGRLEARRYGEPWRDLTGDKLVHSLFDFAQKLAQYSSTKPIGDISAAILDELSNTPSFDEALQRHMDKHGWRHLPGPSQKASMLVGYNLAINALKERAIEASK